MAVVIKNERNEEVEKDAANFRGTGVHIAKRAKIFVPISLVFLLEYIAGNHKPKSEFAVLYKVEKDIDTLNFQISNEFYYIPQQKSGAAVVDLDPNETDYSELGFNGVVHRHPDTVHSFSGTDDRTLNSLFTTSFLYLFTETIPFSKRIMTAIVNLKFDEVGLVQLPADLVIYNDKPDVLFEFVDGRLIPSAGEVAEFVYGVEENNELNAHILDRIEEHAPPVIPIRAGFHGRYYPNLPAIPSAFDTPPSGKVIRYSDLYGGDAFPDFPDFDLS